MLPDEICSIFSTTDLKITIKELDDDNMILIEGDSKGLRFLANLILSLENKIGDSFHIRPDGAGSIFFTPDSTKGIYIHCIGGD